MILNHRFLFFTLFFFTLCVNAQFRLVASGGFTASQVDGDQLLGYSRANPRVAIGVETKRRRAKVNYGFTMGYTGKGANTDISIPIEQEWRFRLHYVDFRGYAKYKVNKHISLSGGVVLGYLISADQKVKGLVMDLGSSPDTWSVEGRIAAQTPLSKRTFFEVAFQHSLYPFGTASETEFFQNDGLFHKALQFGLVFLI